jgi:hypothetical protein
MVELVVLQEKSQGPRVVPVEKVKEGSVVGIMNVF